MAMPMLQGLSETSARAGARLFLDRRASYDEALAAHIDDPTLALAVEVATYLTLRDARALMEIGLLAAYSRKVFGEAFASLARPRSD